MCCEHPLCWAARENEHKENSFVILTMVAATRVLEMKSSWWRVEEKNKSMVPTIYHFKKKYNYAREPATLYLRTKKVNVHQVTSEWTIIDALEIATLWRFSQ